MKTNFWRSLSVVLFAILLSCGDKPKEFTVVQDSTGVTTWAHTLASSNYTLEQSDSNRVIILRSDEPLTLVVPPGMKPGTMFVIMIEP